MNTQQPTPDAELNAVLHEFVTCVQAILGDNFTAAYLQGSFAVGDWDADSDVDFLIATEHDISDVDLPALQAMHGRIYDLPSQWAQHLEGSYFPKELLRKGDPSGTQLLFLDNTSRELIRSNHDNTLIVRWVVREHGIIVAGPSPDMLIDPVSASELRHEVLVDMQNWAQEIFANPDQLNNRWRQPFVVITYCRMLHTLQTGRIGSKPAGAEWAKNNLDRRWVGLIQQALDERPNPGLKVRQQADPADVESTLEFIRYALATGNES